VKICTKISIYWFKRSNKDLAVSEYYLKFQIIHFGTMSCCNATHIRPSCIPLRKAWSWYQPGHSTFFGQVGNCGFCTRTSIGWITRSLLRTSRESSYTHVRVFTVLSKAKWHWWFFRFVPKYPGGCRKDSKSTFWL